MRIIYDKKKVGRYTDSELKELIISLIDKASQSLTTCKSEKYIQRMAILSLVNLSKARQTKVERINNLAKVLEYIINLQNILYR